MLLHRGDPDLTALGVADLDELRAAINAFTARLRLDPVREFYSRAPVERPPAVTANGYLRSAIARLHAVHVLLFDLGQLDRPPTGRVTAGSWADQLAPPEAPPKIRAVIERYLRLHLDANLGRPQTVRHARDALRRLVTWIAEAHPEMTSLAGLHREHAEEFLRWLGTQANQQTGAPLSVSFRRSVITLITRFVTETAAWSWDDVPARVLFTRADIPKIARPLPRFIPDHELAALMTAVDQLTNPYQRAALIVARWSGARRDEIRRLAIDCLDTYPDGHPRLRIPVGKGYAERSIPLHPQAAAALQPLIELARQQRARRRYDSSAGREVQHIFVVRGKLLSKSLLFDMALAEAVYWLQTNFLKTELELGHCLRTPAEGPCEGDLVLTCSKFLTTSDYAPRLRARLAVEQQLIHDATGRGWQPKRLGKGSPRSATGVVLQSEEAAMPGNAKQMTPAKRTSTARQRNPRGQGERLRDDIIEAASRLLADPAAPPLTLRAVAREVGVAATSVYLHFDNIESLVLAVADRRFGELVRLQDDIAETDPCQRVRAACLSYCEFGLAHPGHYQVMFTNPLPLPEFATPDQMPGWAPFQRLIDAVGRCTGADPGSPEAFFAAQLIWQQLHGIVSLRISRPRFPWPPLEQTVRAAVDRLLSPPVRGLLYRTGGVLRPAPARHPPSRERKAHLVTPDAGPVASGGDPSRDSAGSGGDDPAGLAARGGGPEPPRDLDVTRLTPSPPVTAAEAAEAVRACFGLAGQLSRLPGEADDNFLLRTGDRRYVVKVAHLRADPAVVGVQVRVLRHIELTAPGLPVPRVMPAARGQPWAVVADGPLRGRLVHVLSYLDGQLLRSVTTDQALRRTLGGTLAELGRALRGFDDPLVHRPLLWDLAQLPRLRPLLAGRPPGPRTSLIEEQLGRLAAETSPRLAAQRAQLVHNDYSPDNTLISADGRRVCGIIDFGDVTVTALVNDVAIAVANQLGDDADLLGPALDLICGYHATTPLTAAELGLLPDLILGRIVARIIISEWRAGRFPENRGYVLRNTPRAWEHLYRLLSIPAEQIAAHIQEATRA